jgi:predicted phosphoadenosine phosphosulfate sulfurtransferase
VKSDWKSNSVSRSYLSKNVFDAALERIERVFNEFENIIVGYSGGKDSTVVFELAMIVAKKLNRLPLKVMFIDQEAEWQATVDMVTEVMERPDVEPMWFQMPILMPNATSTTDHWLTCWDPKCEEKWMRPKWHRAKTDNHYTTPQFLELFEDILKHDFPNTRTAYLAGVRAEESPGRLTGLTGSLKYQDITWAKILDKKRGHYTFYPLYDWSYTDIWAAIHKNKWSYNKCYDRQYQYGYTIPSMRVSNLHHETAISHLFWLQEIEPKTYEKLVQRIAGIDTTGKLGAANYFPSSLPSMFSSWIEYRDFLLEKLITNDQWKERFKAVFECHDPYQQYYGDALVKTHISSILTNDYTLTKIKNFCTSPGNLDRIPGMRKLPLRKGRMTGKTYDTKLSEEFYAVGTDPQANSV